MQIVEPQIIYVDGYHEQWQTEFVCYECAETFDYSECKKVDGRIYCENCLDEINMV